MNFEYKITIYTSSRTISGEVNQNGLDQFKKWLRKNKIGFLLSWEPCISFYNKDQNEETYVLHQSIESVVIEKIEKKYEMDLI